MLEKLLQFILHQRLLIILAAILLLGAGVIAWNHLPMDAFPDATNQQVMILTNAPGLTPTEVERLVTFPIEINMGGLPGVRQVRSLSKIGLSQVIIIFEDKIDTYFARQVVFERLAQAADQLPEGIEPELGPISTGLGEIYQYILEAGYYCPEHKQVWSHTQDKCPECGDTLTRSQYSLMDLRTIQDWVVSPQLRQLAGVNEVNSFGGFVKQYHVIPDPALLLKYGISLNDILEALGSNNSNAPGSYIVRDFEQINVISKGLAQGIPDIERIVLKAEKGTPVYLRDVAEIRIGSQTRNGVVTKDGQGEVVCGMVIMLKGSNSKRVVDRVRAEIPEIQKSLPSGVRISPFYDRTSLIQACIRTVSTALGQGIIFIILVLFIVLWDIRAALTVAVSLPLTAAAAFILMDWQGVTANLMSLGGLVIAIGMIVDGAIVVTENIARHMHDKSNSDVPRIAVALEAVREVARPVMFAILIIVCNPDYRCRLSAAVYARSNGRQDVQTAGTDYMFCSCRFTGGIADYRTGSGFPGNQTLCGQDAGESVDSNNSCGLHTRIDPCHTRAVDYYCHRRGSHGRSVFRAAQDWNRISAAAGRRSAGHKRCTFAYRQCRRFRQTSHGNRTQTA